MEAFTAGQQVIWLYTPRGGWGFTARIKAEVVLVTPKRVRIKVWHAQTGEEHFRTVTPDKLVTQA